MGGQGGCERRIEDFVKFKKKLGGGGVGSGLSGFFLGGQGVDVNKEVKFSVIIKKNWGGGGRGGEGGSGQGIGSGGQGRCERRSEVYVKIQNKFFAGSGWGVELGGQGRCELRIEVFV